MQTLRSCSFIQRDGCKYITTRAKTPDFPFPTSASDPSAKVKHPHFHYLCTRTQKKNNYSPLGLSHGQTANPKSAPSPDLSHAHLTPRLSSRLHVGRREPLHSPTTPRSPSSNPRHLDVIDSDTRTDPRATSPSSLASDSSALRRRSSPSGKSVHQGTSVATPAFRRRLGTA